MGMLWGCSFSAFANKATNRLCRLAVIVCSHWLRTQTSMPKRPGKRQHYECMTVFPAGLKAHSTVGFIGEE